MKKVACNNCRTKKVSCDGSFPICRRCYVRSFWNCKYLPSQRQGVDRIFNREACVQCRRKKKRCDATRPSCGQCIVSRPGGGECDYQAAPEYYEQDDPCSLTTEQGSISRSFSLERDGSINNSLFLPVDTPAYESSSYRINPSIPFPRATSNPFQPNIIKNPPLSFDDPFAFALSDVSLDDLNMKFRSIFITQRLVYGVWFPPEKLQALLIGDMSSSIIHNFFVHFANLAGTQFYQERCGNYCLLPIQARHLLMSEEALKTMVEEDDPLAFAQAHFYMGSAYTYARSVRAGKRHLKQSVEIINRNNIRFVPISAGDTTEHELNTSPSIIESVEIVQERVALLSQMVFIEVMTYLLGQPSSIMGFKFNEDYTSELPSFYSDVFLQHNLPAGVSELEQQFRYELPDAYPNLISPIVSRVQSELFAKDASNLVTWFQQQDTPSDSWLSTCSIYLNHLTAHISKLRQLTLRSEDAESRLMFRYSSMTSFTAYAQIAFVLAMSSSSSAASASTKFLHECNNALRRVLELIWDLEPNEFLTLSAFIGATWSRALALITGEPKKNPQPFASSSPSSSSSDQYHSASSAAVSAVIPPISLTAPKPIMFSPTNQPDLASNITRLSLINDQFIESRWLPGTSSLCAELVEQKRSWRHQLP